MEPSQRSAALAALLIFGGFALVAYLMPTIMLAVGRYSTAVAGLIAVGFVLAFFGVFWLRAKAQARHDKREEKP